MQIQIINNQQGLDLIHVPPKYQRPERGAKETTIAPPLGPLVRLVPGMNLVDSDVVKELRKNPGFDAKFSTVIEASPAPEQNPECVGKFMLVQGIEVDEKAPLAKLTLAAAKAMIGETFVASMLQDWIAEETRPIVRRALDSQIKQLSTPSAPKGRKQRDIQDGE